MKLYATILGYVDCELAIGETYTVTRSRNGRVLTAPTGETIELTERHFASALKDGMITLSN
jgi:hypothetical protein